MKALLFVFIGGGLGSMCRYTVGRYFQGAEQGFPTKTFIANVLSCIVLGYLIGISMKYGLDNKYKLLFMTGFCGGFSTFSSFSAEVLLLLQNNQTGIAIFYVISSVLICTLCLFLSYLAANQLH